MVMLVLWKSRLISLKSGLCCNCVWVGCSVCVVFVSWWKSSSAMSMAMLVALISWLML